MKSVRASLVSANLKPGDIIGCCGYCIQSDIINIVTYGIPRFSLSHTAILAEHNDDLLLFESTTEADEPCAIRGKRINGTQAHFIDSRIGSYRGKVWHYPLARPLSRRENRSLTDFLVGELGRPYDLHGGLEAVGKIWSAIQSCLHEESLSALFCSEWCAAALREVGRFDTISASQWTPNALVREFRRRGTTLFPRRIK